MLRPYEEIESLESLTPTPELEAFATAAEAHYKAEYDAIFGLGEAVTNRRIALSLSQIQLAEKTGITQADISRIERGKGNPTFDTLKKIFTALQMKMIFQSESQKGESDQKESLSFS